MPRCESLNAIIVIRFAWVNLARMLVTAVPQFSTGMLMVFALNEFQSTLSPGLTDCARGADSWEKVAS